MRFDNYPDDIRRYDSDPRSPFYEGPEDHLEEKAEQCLVDSAEDYPAFFVQCERLGLTVECEAEFEDNSCDSYSYRISFAEVANFSAHPEDLDHYAAEFAALDREHPELHENIAATML